MKNDALKRRRFESRAAWVRRATAAVFAVEETEAVRGKILKSGLQPEMANASRLRIIITARKPNGEDHDAWFDLTAADAQLAPGPFIVCITAQLIEKLSITRPVDKVRVSDLVYRAVAMLRDEEQVRRMRRKSWGELG